MLFVHILHEKEYSRNGEAFVFPLVYHRRRLRAHGMHLAFFTAMSARVTDCDVLIISSKFFSRYWTNDGGDTIIDFLRSARKGARTIIWFDISDSTGTTQFRVLPYVDRYCKNQLLKTRTNYQQQYYGSRMFTDFYHKKFGVDDHDAGEPHLNVIPAIQDLPKLSLGWNSAFAHYGLYGIMLGKAWYRTPFLPRWYAQRWHTPSTTRALPISCRIGWEYSRMTVAFARKRIGDLLGKKMKTNKLSRRAYFHELQNSIAVLSPFGLGEVTLRDFEITRCGAAMVKQDMRHCETWPDLWKEGSTYISFAWDLSDLEQKIEYVLHHPKDMVLHAQRAQDIYHRVLATEEGHQEFCERFSAIIRP